MRPGNENAITITGLRTRPMVAIALGDDFATDIDLYAHRGSQLLDYDDDYDATPICVFTGSSASTTLTVKYVSGTGPSLIMLGIYE
jgi:hypothetical protein